MGGGGWFAALRDQRAELRPLQNLRHQGSEPEHHLGPPRGRRRTQLPQYVSVVVKTRWADIRTRTPKHLPATRRWGYRARDRAGIRICGSRHLYVTRCRRLEVAQPARTSASAASASTSTIGLEHSLGSRRRRRTRLPQYGTDVIGGVTMLPLSRRFKVGGHVQSGQLLRA